MKSLIFVLLLIPSICLSYGGGDTTGDVPTFMNTEGGEGLGGGDTTGDVPSSESKHRVDIPGCPGAKYFADAGGEFISCVDGKVFKRYDGGVESNRRDNNKGHPRFNKESSDQSSGVGAGSEETD